MSTYTVSNVTGLKGISGMINGDVAIMSGYTTPGDGGGGQFYFDSGSSASDNGGTIFIPSGAPPTGRWFRIYSEAIDVRWFGALGDGSTDDTSAITAAIAVATSGELTFGYGGTYFITGTLTIGHSLLVNLNNCTIKVNNVSSGNLYAFTIGADNVTIRNGIILGSYNPSGPKTTGTGSAGITNSAACKNLVVDRVTIQTVQSYGVNVTNVSNLRVINSNFITTGYISLLSVVNTSTSDGGGFIDGNLFDRSAISSSLISQVCVAIRGLNSTTIISNWIVTNNKLNAPSSPTDSSVNLLEARFMQKSTIGNNTCSGGTIGLYLNNCVEVTASKNSFYSCTWGIFVGNLSTNNVVDSNVIDTHGVTGAYGIRLAGFDASNLTTYTTLSNNNVTGLCAACIQVSSFSSFTNIIGGVLNYTNTTTTSGAISLGGIQSTLLSGVLINGGGTGSNGVFMDNSSSPANSTVVNGCMFTAITNAVNVYSTGSVTVTGLRVMSNVASGTMLTSSAGVSIQTPYYYGNSPEIIGSKVIVASGTGASVGIATLVSGSKTVTNPLVTTSSEVFLSVTTVSGQQGILSCNVAGGSFTITSTNSGDNSTISWIVVN